MTFLERTINLRSSAKCVCMCVCVRVCGWVGACICVCVCVLFLDQLASSFPLHRKFDWWLPFRIIELTHRIALQVCYRHHRKKTESSAVPGHWPMK